MPAKNRRQAPPAPKITEPCKIGGVATQAERPSAPGRQPTQAILGKPTRVVFAADPTVVTQLVEQREQIGVVHLAKVRLMAIRHPGDLDVPHSRLEPLEAGGQVCLLYTSDAADE